MDRKSLIIGLSVILISLLTLAVINNINGSLREDSNVNPTNIENFMIEQLELGPRYPGSNGSLAFKDWIFDKISSDWAIEVQNFTYLGVELRNYFITSASTDIWPKYLVGAHYDSRKVADQDLNNPQDPVPGANDAASGVAAILEMMEHIPSVEKNDIGFILFDGEDQGSGGMFGWSWIVGSEYFVDEMTDSEVEATNFFILFDMIANDELELRYERNSDDEFNEQIWDIAHDLGYDPIFQKVEGLSIIDDHRPFLDRGIRAVDLIDLSYPEWHTTEDNMENVSPENAAIVLDVIIEWFKLEFWQSIDSDVSNTSIFNSSSTEMVVFFSFLTFVTIFVIIHFYRKYSR